MNEFGLSPYDAGQLTAPDGNKLQSTFANQPVVVPNDPDKIAALLPQSQCGQCGFPGCRPYAEAIAKGEADINQCPPGGEQGIQALADLLDREPKPLSAEHGVEKEQKTVVKQKLNKPVKSFRPRRIMTKILPHKMSLIDFQKI